MNKVNKIIPKGVFFLLENHMEISCRADEDFNSANLFSEYVKFLKETPEKRSFVSWFLNIKQCAEKIENVDDITFSIIKKGNKEFDDLKRRLNQPR